jgi:hypothetical protein
MLIPAAKMARKKNQASITRRLHRSLGAGAALFIIFMVLSGLAINHSNGLGLDQRHISQAFLLRWYGLGEPEHIRSFTVGNNWLSFAGSQLYLDGNSVAIVSNGVGAVAANDMLIAAGSDELLLLDQTGRLIERSSWSPPGAGSVESIGLLTDGSVVQESMGQLWLADAELLSWTKTEATNPSPAWSVSAAAPEVIRKNITQQYRGDGPSLERILLDVHSGRFLGPIGILIYDLLALGVGFMAISGLILWLRGRRNGKRTSPGR